MNLLLDCAPSVDIRAVFLGNSQAFDKVWHTNLFYINWNHMK